MNSSQKFVPDIQAVGYGIRVLHNLCPNGNWDSDTLALLQKRMGRRLNTLGLRGEFSITNAYEFGQLLEIAQLYADAASDRRVVVRLVEDYLCKYLTFLKFVRDEGFWDGNEKVQLDAAELKMKNTLHELIN